METGLLSDGYDEDGFEYGGFSYENARTAFVTSSKMLGLCSCIEEDPIVAVFVDYLQALQAAAAYDKRHPYPKYGGDDDSAEAAVAAFEDRYDYAAQEAKIDAVFGGNELLRHLVEGEANRLDLTTHGGNIVHSWLEPSGERWLEWLTQPIPEPPDPLPLPQIQGIDCPACGHHHFAACNQPTETRNMFCGCDYPQQQAIFPGLG